MTKGIIPFNCIEDLDLLSKLFIETGYVVTIEAEKKYIRVERIDSNEGF